MAPTQAATSNVTDLSALDSATLANEGVEIVIVNPRTREKTDIKIRVLGADSEEFRTQAARMRRISEMRARSKVAAAVAEDDDDQQLAQLLATCTVGWTGMAEQGELVPFSKAKAIEVYHRFPVIRRQVFEAMMEESNFLPG
jgi:hypothetical protein